MASARGKPDFSWWSDLSAEAQSEGGRDTPTIAKLMGFAKGPTHPAVLEPVSVYISRATQKLTSAFLKLTVSDSPRAVVAASSGSAWARTRLRASVM